MFPMHIVQIITQSTNPIQDLYKKCMQILIILLKASKINE
jgi:hypothetical protein